jgi:transketolase
MSLTHQQCANAVRFLAADAVQQANSGHPGAPMGMADIAEILWREFLRHNPNNPHWVNRDRFVLSNGHASMLLYALLHLTGYDVTIDDIKQFRQLHSKTPGHPEFGYAPGIETTTGPLGQGFANAVGMALAEKILSAQFNRPGFDLINHHTYVFLGDGCLMEGISHETASFAGTFKLNKLIAFWDNNGISIDGEVKDWFTDDTPKRFEAYQWNVIADIDGHNPEEIRRAIAAAHRSDKPTLICCKTTIGFGSPNKSGKESCHGSPLGNDEIVLAREQLHWTYAPFEISEDYYEAWDATLRGTQMEDEWEVLFQYYSKAHPELAHELTRRLAADSPAHLAQDARAFVETLNQEAKKMATRKSSQHAINFFVEYLPELLGGSADLTGSNNTNAKNAVWINHGDFSGNYISYGVREFGMSAIMNGIALYGGFIPFGGTFLVFSDYARNAIRLSALMKQQVIYVLTHDSIGLGEDGPTHQPIEHAASLRLMPNLYVWRPCDTVETAIAWECALFQKHAPSALLLTRQDLICQPRSEEALHQVKRGGYILVDTPATPDIILIATGSEIQLAVDTSKQLREKNIHARVVSMPCTRLFDEQDANYREKVLPMSVKKRIAIEAGSEAGWYQYVGLEGRVIGMKTFGESAPAEQLFKYFGFTVEHILEVISTL